MCNDLPRLDHQFAMKTSRQKANGTAVLVHGKSRMRAQVRIMVDMVMVIGVPSVIALFHKDGTNARLNSTNKFHQRNPLIHTKLINIKSWHTS